MRYSWRIRRKLALKIYDHKSNKISTIVEKIWCVCFAPTRKRSLIVPSRSTITQMRMFLIPNTTDPYFQDRLILCQCTSSGRLIWCRYGTGNNVLDMLIKHCTMYMYLPNPSTRVGCNTRSIFCRFNRFEFKVFLLDRNHIMVKEISLSYYLPRAGGRIVEFIPFPSVLALCEMQTGSSRFWTFFTLSKTTSNHHTVYYVQAYFFTSNCRHDKIVSLLIANNVTTSLHNTDLTFNHFLICSLLNKCC